MSPTKQTGRNWSIGRSRQNFMMQSQANLSTVSNNKGIIR